MLPLNEAETPQEETKKDKIFGMKPNKSDLDQKIVGRNANQTARSHISGLNSNTEEDSLTGLENQLEVGTSIQGVNPNNLNITNSEVEDPPKTKSEHTPEQVKSVSRKKSKPMNKNLNIMLKNT